ncbi:peptide transporter ['Osedax' symbiont bacterium Rs2_46_30_T18]|nr:peptide transporter ['Osedax' symbiont bacterium Rs2_46_30_T18]
MFKSFFPSPKLFFLSLLVYAGICCSLWYGFNPEMAAFVGLNVEEAKPVIGLGFFVTDSFLLFYSYYFVCSLLFAAFWFQVAKHKWQWWSIVGSSLILFVTYLSVQVSVAINHWRKPFFEKIQQLLKPVNQDQSEVVVSSETAAAGVTELLELILIFAEIACIFVFVYAALRFFVNHYVFRWRTAMNDYYTSRWAEIRHIEGASQRVQEDTMKFAAIMENLGVSIVDSVMTLFAFLPVLWVLSEHISELPIVGAIAHPLFYAALFWSIFGTGLLALVGLKLPGLEFKNQRVEAAYRKELVHGEDDEMRAQPLSLQELFTNVRKNYFKLYFHYTYFNIFRGMYLQVNNIFVYILLIPTIAAGAITLGVMQQITAAFNQVSSSFQYLVYSWATIIELISIHKRLLSFEATFDDKPLVDLDRIDMPDVDPAV